MRRTRWVGGRVGRQLSRREGWVPSSGTDGWERRCRPERCTGAPRPALTCPLHRLQLPMEAREALAGYQASVARNSTVRSFMELAGDFGPPGGWVPGCAGGNSWGPDHGGQPHTLPASLPLPLPAAGRCFHLKPTGQVSRTASGRRSALRLRRTKQRRYRAVWIDGQCVIDEGVLISGRMMAGACRCVRCGVWLGVWLGLAAAVALPCPALATCCVLVHPTPCAHVPCCHLPCPPADHMPDYLVSAVLCCVVLWGAGCRVL